jgi:hypothetical protein
LGMFQYDIQFFKSTPSYFLDGEWKTLRGTVGKGVASSRREWPPYMTPPGDNSPMTKAFTWPLPTIRGPRTKRNMATKKFKAIGTKMAST